MCQGNYMKEVEVEGYDLKSVHYRRNLVCEKIMTNCTYFFTYSLHTYNLNNQQS